MKQPGYIPQNHAEVDKGSVNIRFLTGRLNEMGQQGWRLHCIFEQDNTIIVFEQMIPPPQWVRSNRRHHKASNHRRGLPDKPQQRRPITPAPPA
jgi:hypothetical protein